ncbi:MAG TPA: serine/threonine-protein kinase [Polyangiaceae bacterium]
MAEDVFGIVGTTQGGAFRVDEVVAEGGFAVIYRAYHGAFRSNVALKCLKVPRTLSESEQKEFLERFREEAELLFRLSSATPSVVRPLHVGTLTMTDRRFVPFIALEWLEGSTLDKLISTRALEGVPPMDLKVVVKLLTPVAEALYHAHRFPTASGGIVSILHRDLKPENIFIARVHGRDVAKVLDFGIAKVKSVTTEMVGRQSAAESTMTAFTPAYGAPEQWLPKRYGQSGPWTDVWGLAITLVEALCGHAPIEGDHVAMMGSVIDPERRPTPRNEGVHLPDEAEAVFKQALAVDPRERFHDVGAFWTALAVTVGLPGLALDRGQSVVPPAFSSGASLPADPSGRTAIAPKVLEPGRGNGAVPASAVPDLVIGQAPSSGGRSPRGAPSPSPASSAQPSAGKAARRPAAGDPNALVGKSFDFDDDLDGGALETAGGRGGRIGLDLQGGAPPPRAPMSSASAFVPRYVQTPAARRLELGGPLKLVALAVALMAGDWGYAAFTGEILHYGPVRMLWIAGPILGIGVVKLGQRLLSAGD